MTEANDVFQHDALVLRTSKSDHTSHGGFKWPKDVGALVTCPDWKPTEECGNGLHGLLAGLGDWGLIPQDDGRVWQVVGVIRAECVPLGDDKVKFPRCRLIYAGGMGGAMSLVAPQMRQAIAEQASGRGVKRSRADSKPVSTTGNYSAAATTGYYSAAATTGYRSAAATTGDGSAAATTGDGSAAATTGNYSAAATTGNYSAAATTGYYSAAATTGYRSAAATTGRSSVAAALGPNSRAKASEGGAVVVACYGELKRDEESGRYFHPLLAIRAAMVGQDGVKPNVWYTLSPEGQFVAVDEAAAEL
jgi:hypothetical protein